MSTPFVPIPEILKYIGKLRPGFYGICMKRIKPIRLTNDNFSSHYMYNAVYMWEVSKTDGSMAFLYPTLGGVPSLCMNYLPSYFNDGAWVRVKNCECAAVVDVLSNPRAAIPLK